MDRCFQIGDFCFRLICPAQVVPPENFMRFACEGKTPEYTYTVELAERFPAPRGKLIASRADLAVFAQDGLEQRFLGVRGKAGFYAVYTEESASQACILLAKDALLGMHIDPYFVSLLALERRMLALGGIVLHCAYMRYKGRAILFSAPSETGKTTQATLWEKHRGSRVINGDRALLQQAGGVWMARGWPVCGSSEVCHNEDTPIDAIVMLSQSKENKARRLSPAQAFSMIYSQITINRWNGEGHKQAMDQIERLVTQVPVWHLGCTISEEAVACLARALYPGEA